MTKKTNENLLLAILDTYTSGVSNSLETISAMNGVSFRSVYSWLRDPEIILPEYMGEQNVTFGRALNLARNVAKAITISRSLEDRVLNGLKVQVWHHGQPSYVDDEKAILIEDLDLREMIFGYRDGKKRNAQGERIIATRIEAPPAQLVEVYARANMREVYGQRSEVTTTLRGSLGVTVAAVAGPRRPVPPEALAYATAADLEGTVTETVLIEETYEVDTGLAELLGEAPDGEAAAPMPASGRGSGEIEVEAQVVEPVVEPAPREERGAQVVETMITSAPTERETSPPPSPILATATTIPAGWRAEYQALQDKLALPKKTNRG